MTKRKAPAVAKRNGVAKSTVPLNFYCSRELAAKVRAKAKAEERSVVRTIERLLIAGLEVADA